MHESSEERDLHEAERRIEEALAEGSDSLDLRERDLPHLPQSLTRLTHLRKLAVGGRRLTDLGPIAPLKKLEQLDLSWCQAVSDITPLKGLQQLQQLHLSGCDAVSDLTPLKGLQQLQQLDLSWCDAVSDLTPLKGLQQLKTLGLWSGPTISEAQLRDLLEHLPALEGLDCSEVPGIPVEVLSHGYRDNCLPRLRSHFAELADRAEEETEVKVFLLGNGTVGKTQLCRRLRGEGYDPSIDSTHGVEVWRTPLALGSGDEATTYTLNWWDFGGQDVYHGTHALFLRSRALFLVLWDPELENQEETMEGGVPMRNQPLAYWLDYVRSLAGEDTPVVVVQSRCDGFSEEEPAPIRDTGFAFSRSCAYGAKNDFGRETLEAQIRDGVRFLKSRTGSVEIGGARAEVRRRLYELREEDRGRPPEERRHRTLAVERFRELYEEAEGTGDWRHALDYLHQTGAVFYSDDLFAERIILDQSWALEAIYTVFDRGRTLPILSGRGRFTRRDLEALVWQNRSEEEQNLLLDMMEQCRVVFRHRELPSGEVEYVAPDLLPPFEEVQDQLFAWKDDPPPMTLRLEYRFLHQALIRTLMSKVGELARDWAVYWRYGLSLWDQRSQSQLLLRQETSEDPEALGAGCILVQARGERPEAVLREVWRAVRWIRVGGEPRETLLVDGREVPLEALDGKVPEGVVSAATHRLRIAGKTANSAGEGDFDETAESPSSPRLSPGRVPESARSSRRIYLSYAWGDDDSPAGKTRGEVADRLYEALREDGFAVQRDRESMRAGDRISQFMKQLSRGDHVIVVISDRYLQSLNCMTELFWIHQRCQGEVEDFTRQVVPVIFPDLRLSTLKHRAPYIRHWQQEQEDFESLVADLGPGVSPGSVKQTSIVRQIALNVDEMLDFLQDVLMPRRLDAHLDDDFATLRDVLRRRLEA